MEALYGHFFLSNYQHDLHSPAPPAAAEALSAAVEAPRRAARGPATAGSPQASGSSTGLLFALKPPPPPTAHCAVGSPAGGGKAVVIDELRAAFAAVPVQAPGAEADEGRLNVAGVIADDDEQVLLGADSAGVAATPTGQGGDGIDSDSESDASGAAVTPAPAAPPSPPPRPEAPPRPLPAGGAAAPPPPAPAAEARPPAPPLAAAAPAPAAAELQALPAGSSGKFRVHVPKPYPGVQYRSSMCLGDKNSRIAAEGDTVVGVVEEGGKWLRVAGDGGGPALFLPMRMDLPGGEGTHQLLRPIPSTSEGALPKKKAARHSRGSPEHPGAKAAVPWWTCCVSKDMLNNCEVVVERGGDVTGTSPILSTSGEAGGPAGARRGAGLAVGPRLGGERPGGG